MIYTLGTLLHPIITYEPALYVVSVRLQLRTICCKLGIFPWLPLFGSGLATATTITAIIPIAAIIIIENAASLYKIAGWVIIAVVAENLQWRRAGQVLRYLIEIIQRWTAVLRKTVLQRLQDGWQLLGNYAISGW